jgi:2-polyprenyl-3-methyl-5-hydroxy-6-metoxy-1,4-benzoquinol methylase
MALARMRVEELMDRPDVPHEEHVRALRGLETVNQLSLTARQIFEPIRRLGRKELTLLDVACGGGDVPVGIAHLAAREGITIRLRLCDRSATALEQAAVRARAAGLAVETYCADVTRDGLPGADVVTNSLFLHHLDEEDVVGVLRRTGEAARELLVVSDLRRSRIGLGVAWTTCHAFSRSRIMWHDGPVSVKAAWTLGEMRRMAGVAGLAGVDVRRCWPWRMLLTWRKGER